MCFFIYCTNKEHKNTETCMVHPDFSSFLLTHLKNVKIPFDYILAIQNFVKSSFKNFSLRDETGYLTYNLNLNTCNNNFNVTCFGFANKGVLKSQIYYDLHAQNAIDWDLKNSILTWT